MKVSSSELPPRQVSLEIEVEQERFDRAVDAAFRRIASRVNVPGFRKGKAPRPMVERIVGRDKIVEDALEHLVPDVVNEAITQEKVEAYSRPRVDNVELDPLRVKAIVPLSPKVELGNLDDVRVDREEVNITDEQVDEVIQRLRESYAQWVPVEREVRLGDRVAIDVKGEVEDPQRVLMDSKDAEYVVDPEGPEPAPGFAEQVVGMAPGAEKTFTLSLPEDYRDTEIAGKPAIFSVKLDWVKERELPEVNDEFAQQMGEFEDVPALREAIENQLRDREDERVRQETQIQALDKLVEVSSLEVPPQVVEHQADHIVATFAQNIERQGLNFEQYLRLTGKDVNAFREEAMSEADKRVRRSLALDAFADAQDVQVDQSEVEEEIQSSTAGMRDADQARTRALADPGTVGQVQDSIRERKALERLIELATSGAPEAAAPAKRSRKLTPKTEASSDTESESTPDAAPAAEEAQENA